MKQVALNTIVGALAGVAAAVTVVELRYAPGSWFSISGNPQEPRTMLRSAEKPAPDGVFCLYASAKYKPGDVLRVAEADVQLVCTAGSSGGGLWLQVVKPAPQR
jgi:hypothetical protein